jgi:UDP-N-acetylmuramyl pentapeptide phosphotransferase/UDP-N-acetylglucosamine-1-phosphate transferase
MLFGGTLIMLVGVWDDIMGMRPRNKFIAQIVVAGVSMLYGFVIKGFENPVPSRQVREPAAVPSTIRSRSSGISA